MTKKEREKLKQEITMEILKELREGKTEKHITSYNFESYKKDVVADDVEKIRKFIESKRKWHWYLPLVGAFTYGYAINIVINNIDRGTVRTELVKGQMRNVLWYIIGWCGLFFVINFMPEIDRLLLKKVIKRSWERQVKGDI